MEYISFFSKGMADITYIYIYIMFYSVDESFKLSLSYLSEGEKQVHPRPFQGLDKSRYMNLLSIWSK